MQSSTHTQNVSGSQARLIARAQVTGRQFDPLFELQAGVASPCRACHDDANKQYTQKVYGSQAMPTGGLRRPAGSTNHCSYCRPANRIVRQVPEIIQNSQPLRTRLEGSKHPPRLANSSRLCAGVLTARLAALSTLWPVTTGQMVLRPPRGLGSTPQH